jgi:glycosyltransferase involved in cell wall biosynthesis
LVIAGGPGWLSSGIIKAIKSSPGVEMTGGFKTADLPALMRGAEVLVLPSLYEGFGLPVLEAMACGTPTALADNSSLREIAGGSGMFFDPYSSQNMANVLSEILESDKLRNSLQKKGLERVKDFSWEKCARETLEWIKEK